MAEDPQDESPSAGLVVIGNEILSGKTQDSNSPFLIGELRGLGVDLCQISTVPDDPEAIGRTVVEFSRRYHWVFTSGGVGPTHDDMTYEAIAGGFGVPLAIQPRIQQAMEDYYRAPLTESHLHMARVPQGSEVVELDAVRFPPVRFGNVFILPGVPSLFREKFSAIRPLLKGVPILLRNVFLNVREVEVAGLLRDVDRCHPKVMIGSYPAFEGDRHTLKITLESRDSACLAAAAADLNTRLEGIGLQGAEES
ncbi:MAG: molybdopterin-binding protein [Deltaproteobacteria bacterium]|nr:molybdopterin-binding protein [Deltaproteobacteria bacterium]